MPSEAREKKKTAANRSSLPKKANRALPKRSGAEQRRRLLTVDDIIKEREALYEKVVANAAKMKYKVTPEDVVKIVREVRDEAL